MKRVMVDALHPLRFEPIFKRLIWGGRRLATVLGKPIGEGSDYAESWEISDHRADVSRVADGPLAGLTLRDLVSRNGEDLFGRALGGRDQFPLLVKFIDAQQDLSVQVHPDDALGRALANDNGKTETWVIVHAEPGQPDLRRAPRRASPARTWPPRSRRARSRGCSTRSRPGAGDCILIPAGTVHAIGAGVVLAEVQQMSDATFRLHDWGRVGPDGKPRQLHLAEALEAIDFEAGPVAPMATTAEPIAGGTRERLSRSEYLRPGAADPGRAGHGGRPRPVHDRPRASAARPRSGPARRRSRSGWARRCSCPPRSAPARSSREGRRPS